MSKAKKLRMAGFILSIAAAVLMLLPVIFPQILPSLGLPHEDGGLSLALSCLVTGFLFTLSGLIISIMAGDLDSTADFVLFLYSGAFSIAFRARGYEATGLLPGTLLVLCDIADSVSGFSILRMLGKFFCLTRADKKGFLFHKLSYLAFTFFFVRYILVLTGVIDFWTFSFNFVGNVNLWVLFTILAVILFYLLNSVPRQVSLLMRGIMLGFGLGFLPFLCFLAVNSPTFGESIKLYWPPAAVLSLLTIPAAYLCSFKQKLSCSTSPLISKIMTGCASFIFLMCILMLRQKTGDTFKWFLLGCPLVYQLVYIPLDKFLHPEMTAVDCSLNALERTAFRCSDEKRILEVVADWIMSMLNPEFVSFYKKAEKEGKKGSFLYSDFKNRKKDRSILNQMLEERLNKPGAESKFMVHRTLGFSVPMYLLHEPAGFIFIGARSDRELFTDAEIKLLTPVTRILMESMMVLSLRKKAEYVSEMQNQIVFSFADMIESRDGTTGQHIKRTSTVVTMLVKKLREHNTYADRLLPGDYDMIALAAPLHDIGKIKVPDSILSKPGKLTKEEFVTVRIHPVEGEKIIKKTMSHIENERYLKLAREMALYHHEMWNGQGYPEGLAGEDIPISARIMAIADVFDTLCSVRSYKEAYSVSQAFTILEDSRGTQFEPCLVDAMKGLRPELEKLYAET